MAGRVGDTMKTSPAVACMKILLTIFNVYFLLSGIAILALGIWVKVDLHKTLELSDSNNSNTGWLLVCVGLCIILVGLCGCCCTIKGISQLLYVYGFVLMIIFLLNLAISISAFVFKGKAQEEFEKGLKKSMSKYRTDKDTREAVDNLQTNLKCCGNDKYSDWFSVDWKDANVTRKDVPKSCCKVDEKKCKNTDLLGNATAGVTDIYTDGCENKVSSFMEENFAAIGGVAIAFCFIQLFGAFVSCCLAKNINKAKYEQVA